MKLYIATTSLNFDAIVSTDSISPASFYPQRRFGIPFVYEKASLCHQNSILLTDVFPLFNIGKSDVDHRPMVIEIDSANYPDRFQKVRDCDEFSVYVTDRTVYLSPLSCRIVFRSEFDKRATLAKAESILESKYLLYERLGAIIVLDGQAPNVRIDQTTFKGISDYPVLNSESVKKDIQINKAKGFLYSYLIGAFQAVSPDSAHLLRLSKDIKNGIYSLGTKEGKTKTASDAINRLAYAADTISESLDPKKVAAQKKVYDYLASIDSASLLRGSTPDEIILFLEKTDLYRSLYGRLNGGRIFSIVNLVQSVLSSKDDSILDSSLEELQKYVYSIAQHDAPLVQVKELFTLYDLNYLEVKDPILTDESRKKVETMYNLYSGYNYVATGIRENRIDYIIEAGKEFFPEQTLKNQKEREYVNAMLDNLEHATSFDILSVDSAALQALAVFMRTPDADLDKMSSLIVSNEIPDARIAYGLWGLFHGYSSIPQSYYNEFVKRISPKDIIDLIRQVYGMLFNVDPVFGQETIVASKSRSAIKGVLSIFGIGGEKSSQKFDSPSKEIQTSFDWSNDEIDQQESKKDNSEFAGDIFTKHEQTQNDVVQIDDEQNNEEADDLPGYPEVYTELKGIIVTGLKKDEQIAHYCKGFEEVCSEAVSYPAIKNGLDQIDILPGSKTNWDKVKRLLKTGIDAIAREANEQKIEQRRQMIVKDAAAGVIRQFVSDRDAWNVIYPVLPNDREVHEQVKKDLEWFQDNYIPGYKNKNGKPAYYEGNPRDNYSVIVNYKKYLTNKKSGSYNPAWLTHIYLRVNIEDVISALKEVYR